MIKEKSFILSFLLIWLSGGSDFFHNHPFLPGALSISDKQIHYTQHENISGIITCPACLWERTPGDVKPLNHAAIIKPGFPAAYGCLATSQALLFFISLSPRSPPLFS